MFNIFSVSYQDHDSCHSDIFPLSSTEICTVLVRRADVCGGRACCLVHTPGSSFQFKLSFALALGQAVTVSSPVCEDLGCSFELSAGLASAGL